MYAVPHLRRRKFQGMYVRGCPEEREAIRLRMTEEDWMGMAGEWRGEYVRRRVKNGTIQGILYSSAEAQRKTISYDAKKGSGRRRTVLGERKTCPRGEGRMERRRPCVMHNENACQ